jgi:ATP-dependent helicase/nuclease subunit A
MAVELTDGAARDRILTDLDRNLLVQAGAGAGKTHALIGRMVETVRTGREDVQHLAAITFTKKAAGEMRARFHAALHEAYDASTNEDLSRRNLAAAIDRVDQCYIGTIHAFCGRLLRERPLDAGLPPDFSELDERGEWVSLREAWNDFVLDRYADRDPRLDTFDAWGIRTDEFFDFFLRRSQFTDLELQWTEVPLASLKEPAQIAEEWVERVSQWIPSPLTEKPDRLQDALLRATNFLRNRGLNTERDERYLLSLLDLSTGAVVLKRWAPHQDKAKEIRDNALPELLETVIRPALTRWRRATYPEIACFIDEAVEFHKNRRFRAGSLTFQDLLEQAAELLASNPDLRKDFQSRYRRLFVDEFQDTDPLQAEILLYLTADDPEVSDWRDCCPKPGSLFLVGDEKQAIYRFRRADLDIFRYVRDRVRSSGGDVLDLNTSFRSVGGICDWINNAFDPIFSRFDTRYQATFNTLGVFRPPGSLPGHVLRSPIPKIAGNDRSAIARQDASRIAGFIGASISGDASVSEIALPPPVSPSDFMILTRTTGQLDTYARALEQLGIPFTIEGSGKLGLSEELHDLIEVMEVVLSPTNPVPLIGYLRGRLVGLGDDELYTYKINDGQFDYRTEVPNQLPTETAERFELAYDQLRKAEHWLQIEPVSVAIENILNNLGILPFAALQPMGNSRAGNLIRLLAIIRRWEIAGWNWTECLRELQDLRDDPEYKLEEMTLDSGSGASVRLMNLHQAKGLQARVVFLADPYDTSSERHDPDFHVSRSGSEPKLTLPVYRSKGTHGKELVSEPHGWEADSEEEIRFLDAEERRLVYVAATRAEDLLVISLYEGNTEKGPWTELYPFLEGVPELPLGDCPVPDPAPTSDPDFDTVERDLSDKWMRARQRSYATTTVTGEDDRALAWQDSDEAATGRGIDYGLLVHGILEQAVNGHLPANVEDYVSVMVKREEQGPENIAHALSALDRFKASEIWKEIQESKQTFTEVDFAKNNTFMGQTQIERGRIDLVYRVLGGWKIIDFKTDRAGSPSEIESLRKRYGDQVRAYARYWNELAGGRVKSAGLWSTDPGIWIKVD